MSLEKNIKKAIYFTIGAVAVGADAVADVTEELLKKSDVVLAKGKTVFKKACEDKKLFRD